MKKIILILIWILSIIYNITLSQESWIPTSMINAPSAREWHTAIWTGSKMIIWGGYDYNTGGIFDPVTNSWTATSTINAPQGRGSHSAIWTGSKMIIWGGSVSSNTGGIYNPITDSWNAISVINAPSARSFHSAVWTGSVMGGRMIIWGGEDNSGATNTGGIYDPVSDTWVSTSTTNAPVGRYLHSCVWTGSKLIVWGGSNTSWYNIIQYWRYLRPN